MNFAVLTKLKLISGTLDQLVERIKIAVRQPGIRNLAEIAFYRSSESFEEIYVLSFWFKLEDRQEARDVVHAELSKSMDIKSEVIESNRFQLIWEYRLLTQAPAASHIRLLTFPAGYPDDKATEVIEAARTRRPALGGLVGSWIGRCLDNPQLTLQRADWVNSEAMEAFFYNKTNQEIIANRRAQGIEIEYASRNLERFIEYLREPLNDQNRN